ncbi:MAG: hypothetical protein HY257_08095 [Chloroflexi bacterium]|nr:hypothetical protein [Chloroflexota bacterium]
MRLKLATLCDYASVSEGGKLNILGIFSNIWARSAPITHALMYLVAQMEFDFLEVGQKQFRVVLVDEDGKETLNLGGEMNVPQATSAEPANVNQIFVFNNTTFPKFGDYEFQVSVNGETCAQISLRVLQMRDNA